MNMILAFTGVRVSSVENIKVPTAFFVKNKVFPEIRLSLSWTCTVNLSNLYVECKCSR